jgi:hypothetical protein
MKAAAPRYLRRSLLLASAAILAMVLTACTGRGGGQLPPQRPAFTGSASFGFSFSCEDKGGLNPQAGRLHIELSYADKGTNPIGSAFSIHGTADTIDPVLESAVCIGQEPPLGEDPHALTFLGRYYLTSSPPAKFPSTCPSRETTTTPLCRFEVTVQDNDRNLAPSPGDHFSITLTTDRTACGADFACSQLPVGFYTRGGPLSSGNLTVD